MGHFALLDPDPDPETQVDADPDSDPQSWWICIVSSADPGSSFYLNADPDPDQDTGSQTNAYQDLDPGQTLKSQKVKFLHAK